MRDSLRRLKLFVSCGSVCALMTVWCLPEAAGDLNTGLIAHYPFDGDANDASGNGNHATAFGGVSFVPGQVGTAAHFGGIADYVECNSSAVGNFGPSDFTISCWVRTATGGGLVGKRSVCSCSTMIDLRAGRSTDPNPLPQNVLFEVGDDASCPSLPYVDSPLAFTNGAWHHVVAVRSGNSLLAYVNGVKTGETNTPQIATIQSSTALRIGTSACTGIDPTPVLVGEIDEVRIYSRALSADEIAQLAGCNIDADCDGVADGSDSCSDTPSEAIVNADGCSVDQLVPCSGPASGGTWKNHGAYVSAVARQAEEFLVAGLITAAQKDVIVSEAAESNCGK